MKGWFATRLQAAIAAAASLTGKRFGLLVASSVVATAGIVAAAATSGGKDNSALAALVGQRLAAARTPVVAEAAPEVEPTAPEPEFEPEVEEEIESEPLPEVEEAPLVEEVPESAPIEEVPPEAEAEPEAEPEPEEEAPPPVEEAKPEAGQVKHVFVVSLASPGYDAAWSPTKSLMPYLSGTLRPEGDLLTGYKLLSEDWLPNSFASLAGQAPTPDAEKDCPSYEKCIFPAETLAYPSQLESVPFTWGGYFESMVDSEGKPANCVYPQPGAEEEQALGGYAPELNPFIYFHSLLDLGGCSTNVKPIEELEKDLRKPDSTPNFSYISPDLCDAGVPGQCEPGQPEGAAAADAWLQTWIPKIMKSPAYKADGLLVVTFGSVSPVPNPTDPTQPPTPPTSLKTGTLLVSKFLPPGATDGARYDPYSLLATNEDLFGLGRLGEAGAKKVKSLGPELRGEASNGGD